MAREQASSTLTSGMTNRWWKLAGVWFLYMSFGLSMASLAPLVEEIESSLRFSHAAMGSVMAAWQFIYLFAAIPGGLLLDRIGAKWGLAVGALVIGVSGILRGYADTYVELLLAVSLFGLGGPLISAGAPKVVSENFTGSQRGLAMGIYISGPGVGAMIALLATQPILLPMMDGNWQRLLQLWGLMSLAAGSFWLWVARHEHRHRSESEFCREIFVNLKSLLRIPAVQLILVMSIAVFGINHGMGNWLVEILKQLGLTAEQASLWAAVPVGVGILSALTLPRLATGRRRFQILIVLFSASVVASTLLLFQPTGLILLMTLVFEGIAAGSMMTVLLLTLVEVPEVGERRAGTASGFFFAAAEIGGVGGPVLLGSLFALNGNFDLSLAALAFLGVFLIAAVFPLRRWLKPA